MLFSRSDGRPEVHLLLHRLETCFNYTIAFFIVPIDHVFIHLQCIQWHSVLSIARSALRQNMHYESCVFRVYSRLKYPWRLQFESLWTLDTNQILAAVLSVDLSRLQSLKVREAASRAQRGRACVLQCPGCQTCTDPGCRAAPPACFPPWY